VRGATNQHWSRWSGEAAADGNALNSWYFDGVDEEFRSTRGMSTIFGSTMPDQISWVLNWRSGKVHANNNYFGGSSGNNPAIKYIDATHVRHGWGNMNFAGRGVTFATAIADNTWYQLGGTMDNIAGAFEAYLNGALDATNVSGNTFSNLFSSAVMYAGSVGTTPQQVEGNMYQFAWWNTKLTLANFQTLYTLRNTYGGYTAVATANLVHYWPGSSVDVMSGANGIATGLIGGDTGTAFFMEQADLRTDVMP
jgi:hypothetical protein